MTEDLDLSAAMRVGARVAAMSDLRDVRLFEAGLKLNTFPGGDSDLTWEIEMAPTVKYSEGDDFFILEVDYLVQIEMVDDDDTEEVVQASAVANIDFKLAALFSLETPSERPDPSTSELDAYAKTMGAMALYPYAREFIQNSSSRMGLPALTLSTFRLPYPDTSVPPSFPEGGTSATPGPA
jgi:preprotein translocase subunit SecB